MTANESRLLKATLDSSIDMVQAFRAVRNRNNTIIDFEWLLTNKAAELRHGNVIGQSMLIQNPDQEDKDVFDLFKRITETGEPESSDHYYVHKQFQGWFYMSTVKFEDGVVTTMKDIANEQQLRKLLKQRDGFIAIASHELKTPVTSIKTYAEIVQEKLRADKREESELIARLNVQIDRLTVLITHMLDTTLISEGLLKIKPGPVDISKIIRERVEEIKTTTSHQFSIQQNEVPEIMADQERIGQVITNLLSNAIKYSPANTTITITCRKEQEGVIVSVQDQGFGIPEQDIHKLFQRYFRVSANNMDTFPGMGLGLYISAQIVQKHGGSINVTSKEGSGATFSFTLPCTSNKP